jgi:hypothetical protein
MVVLADVPVATAAQLPALEDQREAEPPSPDQTEPWPSQSSGGTLVRGRSAETATPVDLEWNYGSRVGTERTSPTTALDEAIGALQDVALGDVVRGADAARAARLLRSAAVERRVSAPRVAGVALLVGDALLFTRVEGLSKPQRAPLRLALRLLNEPFVAQMQESQLVDSLLDHGWEVTASLEPEAFGELARAPEVD